MFGRVLVANRGEIACRVMATLREHGIEAIAVHSEIDRDALHVRRADRAVLLGPAEPQRSYLDVEAILRAARETGAEAIHPGYGFLAENAAFAEAVEAAGLVFLGPTPGQVRLFGDKRSAREAARAADVPVVPGAEPNAAGSAGDLRQSARRIGYPVIVKAALGGGGKGMQIVRDESELEQALESAARLGASAFGDAAVYLERAIERPRHVEVQVVGDGSGHAVHVFERECSLQRRHQKVIEEAPSPGVDDALRAGLHGAAVRLAESVRYRGAGTVEFLVGGDGSFYFLEMNTRLQVEHPVTEWVSGLDLVYAQLQVGARGTLPFRQEEVARRGWSVESRIYAEDPLQGFLPRAGTLARVEWPRRPFVRVDDGVETGSVVPVHYDPILAKIAAWGPDRATAWERLARALDETHVHGVTTNLDFLRELARDPAAREGRIDTAYLEREFVAGWSERAREPAPELALAAAALAEWLEPAGATAARPGSRAGERSASDPFAELGRWRQPGLD